MAKADDRILDNLIRGVDELISGLDSPEAMPGAPPEAAAAPGKQVPPEPVPVDAVDDQNLDGSADVVISKDEMLALLNLHPPTGSGAPVTLDAVRDLIEGSKLTALVDWEAVKGSLLTCNEERVPVSDVVVARGRHPADEIPASLAITESLLSQEKQETPKGGRVDFRILTLFTLVRKGDVLATVIPRREGVMGATVLGAAVSFRKESVSFPKPGKNTAWQNSEVVAGCDGKFHVTAQGFWVDEVLDITGDVDLRVGNIEFPGDVVIRGAVRDGFTIKAGKSLLCMGPIEAARIECGGDLVTHQGIIGKDKAVLHVGGSTEAKFVEGCVLESRGSIRVKTSVMNAKIRTSDRLEMGDRGVVIGGVIRAQNGVSAAQIGAERGPRTEIHCGIDFDIEQKLVSIRDRTIALAFKLREIEAKMKTSPSTGTILSPLREKVKAAIHQLNDSARSMVSGLDKNENAAVAVREFVYPGTYVEICHVSHFVTKPRRFMCFKLDKPSGKVVETKWTQPVEKAPS